MISIDSRAEELAAMDALHAARRSRRTRNARVRRRCVPRLLDALEERTLLSATLIKDINRVNLTPSQITGAGGNIYFVTTAADGGTDLDVKTATGTTVLKEVRIAGSSGSSTGFYDLTPVGA